MAHPTPKIVFRQILFLTALLNTTAAAPFSPPTSHIPQTPLQPLAKRIKVPPGMNEAGYITLLVFGPLAGVMFLWAAWFVCISDCFERRAERKKALRVEEQKILEEVQKTREEEQKARKEREEQIQKQFEEQKKSRGKLQKRNENGGEFEMQNMKAIRV